MKTIHKKILLHLIRLILIGMTISVFYYDLQGFEFLGMIMIYIPLLFAVDNLKNSIEYDKGS